MNTKEYLFTFREMTIIRNALIEYAQFVKCENPTESRKELIASVEALKDQFKNDVRVFMECTP